MAVQYPDSGFWTKINGLIDKKIKAALNEFETNYRPRGAAGIPLCIGVPGGVLAAAAMEWGQVHVPFPGVVTALEIYANDPGGTGTFDIKMATPEAGVAAAASIFGGTLPTLDDGAGGAARYKSIPADPTWTTLLKTNCVLLPFCTAASGLSVVTLNLIVRCT